MRLQSEDLIGHYQKLGVSLGSKIAVGVSGGADSLCLMLMTAEYFDVTAISVDHGLRSEAADEVEFVARLCHEKNIPHVALRWEGNRPTSNIQATARTVRYDLMRDWCAENNIAYLAVAHHQDDQAETLLLRLARGSGVYGLAAMPGVRGVGRGVSIVRPLLSVPKEVLTSTLRSLKQEWIEDPSNQ
ncbi:MAG: tRNA lysidine(34) synthetase TilS, partial [Kordiimonas sp.]